MVGLCLLLLALLLAKSQAVGFNYNLPKAVLEQLSGSSIQFDAWTRDLGKNLNTEQQQRLAWNVRFLEMPRSASELRQLQQQLSPSNVNQNPLKLWLWISFYWQLRRSHRLDKDNMLLPHFVLTLRQLQQQTQFENDQLQNMLQSLPRFLIDLVTSRWLCLKHDRDQVYLLPGGALQLGANSNCSMWQVQRVEEPKYFLRLQNACEEHSTWFVNMLHTDTHFQTYMLLDANSDNVNIVCLQHGNVHLEQARGWNKDCQWQLNDCTQLPTFLNKNKRNRNT
ncbi:uncharacterized protein LOC117785755 [Drosophila innubila]|uniref:uncharacterized protein LOC117785755 n=1 Tax=Drosophila innubila TaxID=198719 RepID=UPI00148D2754|nr:uncharacterized protein LOC117785755 [Drosophila innubila]